MNVHYKLLCSGGGMNWSSVLDTVSRVVAAVVVVAGAFAAVFNATLVEWIKNKFAHAVSRELENYKHQLSRELEAYKASMLRELEEFKLGVDLRRNIALKMA